MYLEFILILSHLFQKRWLQNKKNITNQYNE